jgi:hypothetical protein
MALRVALQGARGQQAQAQFRQEPPEEGRPAGLPGFQDLAGPAVPAEQMSAALPVEPLAAPGGSVPVEEPVREPVAPVLAGTAGNCSRAAVVWESGAPDAPSLPPLVRRARAEPRAPLLLSVPPSQARAPEQLQPFPVTKLRPPVDPQVLPPQAPQLLHLRRWTGAYNDRPQSAGATSPTRPRRSSWSGSSSP